MNAPHSSQKTIMKPRSNQKTKPVLSLVINHLAAPDLNNRNDQEKWGTGTQLEMFEKQNSVFFASVENLAFDDIQELFSRHNFHHILDLREVPFLNFGRSSRNAFFQLLVDRSADYLSLLSVAMAHEKQSIHQLLDEHHTEKEHLSDELSELIEHGPTLVFTALDRDKDLNANRFSDFLSKANIDHTEANI